MDDRTKFFAFFGLVAGFAVTGCGINQQARFQMSFLPRAPYAALDEDHVPPPPVKLNPYLENVPPVLFAAPVPPKPRTHGDVLMQDAEQAFQRGKKAYQANDLETARQQFDAAIDLMFQASMEGPGDRVDFDQHLDTLVDSIHRFELAGMGASTTLEADKFEKAPLEDILQLTFPVDPKQKDKVRQQLSATVSQLPLSVNDTVLGYINYFTNRGHKTIIAATERSGRYRPMIQRILDEEGVPQELIHLAQAESGFAPRAMSRAAAGGMWQFLTWRGQQYGLMQTRYTDDRMDPEKATRAAARHLRDLYSEFGDWYLAIAAYNCGPGVVEKAVERTGYADFWELRNRGVLPAETTNYVPIILAMTIMEKNAADYGLSGIQFDPPMEYDSVQTTATTSLSLVADIGQAPVSEIAEMNPAVLRGIAPENYTIRVPKGSGNQIITALETVPAQHRDSWRMHQVGPGETLAAVAKRYGVATTAIAQANNLKEADMMEGSHLLIPMALRVDAPVRRPAPRSTTNASVRKPPATATRTPVRAAAPARTTVVHTTTRAKTAPAKSTGARKPAVIVARTNAR